MRWKRTCFIAVAFISSLTPVWAFSDEPDTVEAQPAETPSSEVVDQMLRTLFLGVLDRDADAVESVILPHPEADVLTSGPSVPEEVAERVRGSLAAMTHRRVEVGDVLVFGEDDEVEITDEMLDGAVMVIPIVDERTLPNPLVLLPSEAGWRINAEPLIMARKEAIAAAE